MKEMYCVSYFAGKHNFQPFYPLIANDGNPKPNKMNSGLIGTAPKQGEFKKGGHGGGTRKGDGAVDTGENR